MTRRHGRTPRGARVDAAVPHGHWKVLTLTAAVRLGGVGGCLVLDGATDAMVFETYAERLLAPGLRPGDIVIMDNLPAHKHAPAAAAAIRAAGAEVRFLPAYSPCPYPLLTGVPRGSNGLSSARRFDRRRTPGLAVGQGRRYRYRIGEMTTPWTHPGSTPASGPASNSASPIWATDGVPSG